MSEADWIDRKPGEYVCPDPLDHGSTSMRRISDLTAEVRRERDELRNGNDELIVDLCAARAQNADLARSLANETSRLASVKVLLSRQAELTTALDELRAFVREVASSGVEFDGRGMPYVVIQTERKTWDKLQKILRHDQG